MEEALVVDMADTVVDTVDLDLEKDLASAEELALASAEELALVPLQSQSLPLPAVEFKSLISVDAQSPNLN